LEQWVIKAEGGELTLRMEVSGKTIDKVLASVRPPVPPYPYWGKYGSEEKVVEAAMKWSSDLEQYIKDWLDGRVPAEIPAHLIPESQRNDRRLVGFRLVRPEEIDADDQWIKRFSVESINVNDAYGEFWDPHVTYGLITWMMVPFGSKVIIEGEFPRCRFFSLQLTHSFDPKAYVVQAFGSGEVSFVDADIEPLPGHVNPFRVGADRNAKKRSFRVEATSTIGDPTKLDPAAWKPGVYRDPGNNHRHVSGISYTGPWGDPDWEPGAVATGEKQGRFTSGVIWLRMYGLDHAHRPQGGVKFPKVTYQLPDGRKYFIAVDFGRLQAHINRKRALVRQAPVEMNSPGVGWTKMMSILRAIVRGVRNFDPYGLVFTDQYLRDFLLGVEGRGEGQSGVRGLQPAATCCVHIDYFTRGMSLGKGKVIVISGKMPTTPNTRGGAATMTAAQARYWSLSGYSADFNILNPDYIPGVCQLSVMDDEVVKNANQEYVIVLSRPEDRPANATAENGVTWIDWGPEASLGFTLRWLSIKPEWSFDRTPSEPTIGYNSDPFAKSYDPKLIGRNDRTGFLGEYQPVVGYMTREEFEKIRPPITPDKIPPY
jgi:hypothetical protein